MGLSGPPSPDVVSQRTGIVPVPHSASGVCRAWVQFAAPRRISVEELIIGDLFAQAFAITVDRLVSQDLAAECESQLRDAVEVRKAIGQATGIMRERHRLTSAVAFELLRAASQNRNVKLREIAQRITDTGQEPTALSRTRRHVSTTRLEDGGCATDSIPRISSTPGTFALSLSF